MQLGSFYGFTAPMLLLSYDAELLTITQGFNAALNRVAAMDTKQELICFERVLSQIPVLYQPKSAGILEKYSTSAMVQMVSLWEAILMRLMLKKLEQTS